MCEREREFSESVICILLLWELCKEEKEMKLSRDSSKGREWVV